ncbi:50S ribosomal protein L18 [Thalassotalea ponticola]|uniref:50S ribosomal protein L18 n=1 Tax=Thalassotalea ponticola TaxID=1523392 RepID=UPI0025B32E30|nr:50S ribosomal protein L18 [Thalassotalea ponticola]MDN3653674.1 50S ribosomal protein L18 [Thalassotalea ponticola]
MDKKTSRLRRAKRTRAKISELGANRLVVHRTPRHIYAQLITADAQVVASASTLDKEIREQVKATSNKEAAAAVGKAIAERAAAKGIESVAFDRSGFLYHGRIQTLAEAAREAGLKF